ncbi:hypothetical protein RHMOL_Rhmol02G0187500 [Rhododendron molle]|uniref:Uncharacterized protein n=1 Tax=Rhododendron molle TaxID=49168 RepID=A0ACC0PS25_RHOML|nr:hypothetical protein RHMOL_Rhmol02G0187500 [Rhododendron molle]
MDMRALGTMLEEIETDIICLQALDKVEQQLREQEEQQEKKRQKVIIQIPFRKNCSYIPI